MFREAPSLLLEGDEHSDYWFIHEDISRPHGRQCLSGHAVDSKRQMDEDALELSSRTAVDTSAHS